LIQIGLEDDPHMKGTPQLTSLAKDEKARVIYRNISGISRMSRALWVAPEVPADRVEILRKAFAATMKDAAFLTETKKTKLEITPTSPQDIQASAKELASMPKEYIAVLRGILDDKKKK
jgi:hypothetical protein